MSARFEELDWRETALGPLSLRRRRELSLGVDVYEVKLGDEFLMSSLFTVAEVELARLGLRAVTEPAMDVLVGGLGLGYTAHAALQDPRVRSLTVVEALDAVIEWHQRDLFPDTFGLAADPRTRLVHDDFFALVARDRTAGAVPIPSAFSAVLLDIDHTPRHVLHPSHAAFYTADGLGRLKALLRPHGVFGLWSDDPPDDDFTTVLRQVFPTVSAHVVSFPNSLTGGESANTVYLAIR